MRPKVVHIITKLELGGAQQNTLYTLEHLDKGLKGFLVTGPGGILNEEAVNSPEYITSFCPFLVRKINPFFDFLAFIWLFFYLLELKPRIVHTHSSKAGILARWAAYLAGVPKIIHTFHGFGFTPLQPVTVKNFFVELERLTAKITDKLIAVSYANISRGLAHYIGTDVKYKVIRSGINPDIFEKKTRFDSIKEELSIPPKKKLVGNISCFKPQKGLHNFIRACSRLAKKGDYEFILVGDGAQRFELKEQAIQSGIKEQLHFLGWREDIPDILSGIDVLLHTAYFEGLPRVLLEAMASGTPVVATAVDGALDIIEDGKNGFLVAPDNIDRMVEKTYKLLKDDKFRKKIAHKYKESFKPEFNIKTMSDNLNNLYLKLIKKGDNND
ncbi:MAG: glycosyltransferase family 4 protein [Elusimicrobiota bacterium]